MDDNKCPNEPSGNHEKVYSPIVLTSNPAQHPWICRKCGYRGVDMGQYYGENEYEKVLERFLIDKQTDGK